MIRGRLAVASIAVVLGACSGLLESDSPVLHAYVLKPPEVPAIERVLAQTVGVPRPFANPGLDTDRIILVTPDRRLDFFSGARWAAPATEVVGAMTVDALRSSGAFGGVQGDAALFPADYFLQLNLRHFEAQYAQAGGVPEVRVTIDATLGRRLNRAVVSTFTAESIVAADGNRLSAVVAAFEKATQTAVLTLQSETIKGIAGDSTAQ